MVKMRCYCMTISTHDFCSERWFDYLHYHNKSRTTSSRPGTVVFPPDTARNYFKKILSMTIRGLQNPMVSIPNPLKPFHIDTNRKNLPTVPVTHKSPQLQSETVVVAVIDGAAAPTNETSFLTAPCS